MGNRINNKYEYRSGLLDSLKVQHTASDVRNEDEYRKKVLNGLGVEYTDDDINQKSLYRAKVVEGLASSGGGGGGGSSDFSTAEVTIVNNMASGTCDFNFIKINEVPEGEAPFTEYLDAQNTVAMGGMTITNQIALLQGYGILTVLSNPSPNISLSGDIEDAGRNSYFVTGDCTITIS